MGSMWICIFCVEVGLLAAQGRVFDIIEGVLRCSDAAFFDYRDSNGLDKFQGSAGYLGVVHQVCGEVA
jgi:hypothetical protein